MSRSRQISAIDIAQKERSYETFGGRRDNFPANNYHSRRQNMSILKRLRSGGTQELISGGCSNMRDLCNSVQGITAEINNLLSSIENFLPLINTYLNATQSRETINVSNINNTPNAGNTSSDSAAKPLSAAPTANAAGNIKQPRPEDIQQLLENPLVKNLLAGFVQNAAGKSN